MAAVHDRYAVLPPQGLRRPGALLRAVLRHRDSAGDRNRENTTNNTGSLGQQQQQQHMQQHQYMYLDPYQQPQQQHQQHSQHQFGGPEAASPGSSSGPASPGLGSSSCGGAGPAQAAAAAFTVRVHVQGPPTATGTGAGTAPATGASSHYAATSTAAAPAPPAPQPAPSVPSVPAHAALRPPLHNPSSLHPNPNFPPLSIRHARSTSSPLPLASHPLLPALDQRRLSRLSSPAATMPEYRHMRSGSLSIPSAAHGAHHSMPRSPPSTLPFYEPFRVTPKPALAASRFPLADRSYDHRHRPPE